MKQDTYNELRQDLFNKACGVSKNKGKDYTRGSEDVLQNFKSVGERCGLDPKEVLFIYMDKHQDAIANYIKTNGLSESEPIEMRILDNINYLFLLWGLITENETKMIKENRENFFSKSKRETTPTMDSPKTINILPEIHGEGYKIYVDGGVGSGRSVLRVSSSGDSIQHRSEEPRKNEHLEKFRASGSQLRKG